METKIEITIAFFWLLVTRLAGRDERKTEEEGMIWAYLWTKGCMRMRISWTYSQTSIIQVPGTAGILSNNW